MNVLDSNQVDWTKYYFIKKTNNQQLIRELRINS